jgi:hypothetical protein
LKNKEAFLKTQPRALLLKTLKHKTGVFEMLLQRSVVDAKIVEVDSNELV